MVLVEKAKNLNTIKREVISAKVVVRCLPPSLTLESFIDQVSPLAEYDYLKFVAADLSLGQNAYSRAYINFKSLDDILVFREKFDGYVFLDSKGIEYTAIVEFAPFQKYPKNKNRKVDNKKGKIEQDADYLTFVESLTNEDTAPASSLEANLEEIEAKEKELKANHGVRKVSTPLLEYLKWLKDEKKMMVTRAKDERKRREAEKKRREEERKRKRERDRERQLQYERERERERQTQKERRDLERREAERREKESELMGPIKVLKNVEREKERELKAAEEEKLEYSRRKTTESEEFRTDASRTVASKLSSKGEGNKGARSRENATARNERDFKERPIRSQRDNFRQREDWDKPARNQWDTDEFRERENWDRPPRAQRDNRGKAAKNPKENFESVPVVSKEQREDWDRPPQSRSQRNDRDRDRRDRGQRNMDRDRRSRDQYENRGERERREKRQEWNKMPANQQRQGGGRQEKGGRNKEERETSNVKIQSRVDIDKTQTRREEGNETRERNDEASGGEFKGPAKEYGGDKEDWDGNEKSFQKERDKTQKEQLQTYHREDDRMGGKWERVKKELVVGNDGGNALEKEFRSGDRQASRKAMDMSSASLSSSVTDDRMAEMGGGEMREERNIAARNKLRYKDRPERAIYNPAQKIAERKLHQLEVKVHDSKGQQVIKDEED